MENYSYSSYPDSGDSSPRSREIDDTQSWDEPPSANYKVKFMCSYGGKIQPRPHDNQLAYIGGDTKILALDRSVKYSAVMSKLTSLCGGDSDLCFKYQLPGEDLDALISVTNDEDLEHMMIEYDRLCRGGASVKPARLRLFLFNLSPRRSYGSGGGEGKSEGQWFVDALNSVPVVGGGHHLDSVSVPAPPPAVVSAGNPDFLFGLEKGFPSGVPITKLAESAVPQGQAPAVPEVVGGGGGGGAGKDFSAGSDCGSEDRHVMGDPVMNQQQQQQHIQDFQRFQISNHEQIAVSNSRGFPGEFYAQKVPEKMSPTGPSPVPVHVQMPMSGTYVQERHVTSAGPYSVAGNEQQQVYLIPASSGMYQTQALRPMTGQMGHPGYYGVQRVVQEVYREQPPAYNAMQAAGTATTIQQQQQQQQQQATKVGVYSDGIGAVQQKVWLPEQQGYVQVGYDSAGRQVYFTSQYQPVSAAPMATMDARQGVVATGGGAVTQDVKPAANAAAATAKVPPAQASSV